MMISIILLYLTAIVQCKPPNIVIIVADDLGWNDVSFHGSNQIPTPNIDSLAYTGVILNNYYVNPICTPSRSALMTGRHPIHTGLQDNVLVGAAPYALSPDVTILPQHLARLGYMCHAVGKWHLGSHTAMVTPTHRGFLSHVGYWTGHEDYYDHTAQELYGPVHGVIHEDTPYGLSPDITILPQYLHSLGYLSHSVGKWHLGHCTQTMSPTNRGFLSHVGYWGGKEDYYTHLNIQNNKLSGWGFDFRRNMSVAWSDYGKYATDIFTHEAVDRIKQHDQTKPLFLYLAHLAVHSANTYSPLQAPKDAINKHKYIKDENRRKFSGMLYKLDESVGKVVSALQQANMLDDTIIVFTTDNGGPAAGFNQNAASNWPLRGVKDTLWEGGVRGSALVWSRQFQGRGRVSEQMMTIHDWLPTLVSAAGGNVADLDNIDGMDMWSALVKNTASPRNIVLHNIDPQRMISSIRVGDYKMVRGQNYHGQWDGWYGPDGRQGDIIPYNIDMLRSSEAATAMAKIKISLPSDDKIMSLRSQADVKCNKPDKTETCDTSFQVCIFNIKEDPCELNNLVFKLPSVAQTLDDTLRLYNSTAVPPRNRPIDPRADPKYYDYVWTNWCDYVEGGCGDTLAYNHVDIRNIIWEKQLQDMVTRKLGNIDSIQQTQG